MTQQRKVSKALQNCTKMCCALDGTCCGCCKAQARGPACERGVSFPQIVFYKLGMIAAVRKAQRAKEQKQ